MIHLRKSSDRGHSQTNWLNTAIQRMVQCGVIPVTWMQVLCELQRDWARQETYEAVTKLAKEHGGAYGLGIFYAQSMIGGHGG